MGLADIVRKVRAEFTVEDKQAIRAGRRIRKTFEDIESGAGKVRRSVGRALMLPAAVAGIGATSLVGHLVQVGKEAESGELRLTSMLLHAQKFSNLSVGGFGQARTVAKELREEIERMAVASPVTAAQIEESLGTLTLSLSKAGLSLREQAKLSRDVATREQLEGLQGGTTARDIKDILAGRKVETQTASLRGVRDEAVDLVREGKSVEALTKIRHALSLTQEELDAFGDSFEGKLASAQDAFTKLKRSAAAPLMEYLKGKLDELTGGLAANEEKAKAIAREWGEKITSAVAAVVEGVQWLVENLDTVVAVAQTLATVWLGSALVGAISGAVRMVATLHGWLLKAAAASRAIGGGLGGLGGGGGGGMLGRALKGAAVGAGVVFGADMLGGGINSLLGNGTDASVFGTLADLVTGGSAGGITFDTDPEQAKINAKAYAEVEAHNRKVAERKAAQEQGILDKQLKAVATEAEKKGKKRGGGGSRDVRIDRATVNIAAADVDGETFVRLATPHVLALFDQAAGDRPISAEAGLSGIPVPNGAGPGR